jgi:hypothetical protein
MKLISIVALLTIMAGCDYQESAATQEAKHQEVSTKAANMSVGMPAIVNYQEKRILKNILELRDGQIKTITYTQDLNAGLHKLCDSVGYGIPYATQYTNPQQDTFYTSGSTVHVTLPQPDPNGLYSPSSADGTWVMCLDPSTDKLAPVYVEPHVIVSPFPLPGVK